MPTSQSMQPSVALLAPRMDGFCPGGQTESVQDVAAPPKEYEPMSHFVQPSTLDVAPTAIAISPALQFIGAHEVAFSPVD